MTAATFPHTHHRPSIAAEPHGLEAIAVRLGAALQSWGQHRADRFEARALDRDAHRREAARQQHLLRHELDAVRMRGTTLR